MYNEYFGFKESPFSIAPDPRYLYMTDQHRDALAHLVYGLNSEGGCILLTGEVGTGKTTICRCLLEQIPQQAKVALVLNPKLSEIELLETICDELKIEYPNSNNSVKTYTDRIYQFLIDSNRNNEKIVLIIDEAQNLDSKVLEQLRLLTNLETNQRKLLQIIILGQPELLDILAKKEMRQLAQRITARFHLEPLTKSEVKAYVDHRLAVAGQNIRLFPENTIKLLFKLSNGIPRLINIICDRALLGAYVENQYAVNTRTMKKAAKEVFGELKNVEKNQKNKQWLQPLIAITSLAIISITTLFYLSYTQNNQNAFLQTENISDIEKNSASDAEVTKYDKTNDAIDQTAIKLTDVYDNNVQQIETSASTLTDVSLTEGIDTTFIEGSTRYDDITLIINTKTNNESSAFQSLFNTWGLTYDTETRAAACKQARTASLSCLFKHGNLNNLRTHNRPAVLSLVNDRGETSYITIIAMNDTSATVYSNNNKYQVKLSDIDKYWFGKFTLLWKKPKHYSSIISPGDSGEVINWLNTQILKVSNNPSDMIVSTYDQRLINEIKTFQSQHGLTADGIVGPITIIHLNTQSGMNVPTLSQQG